MKNWTVLHVNDLILLNIHYKMLYMIVSMFQISSGLQKLLGKPTAVGVDNLAWSILKPLNTDCQHTDVHHIDALMENDSKLNVALGLMHECFEPVKEHRTGRDIIEDVIFCRE